MTYGRKNLIKKGYPYGEVVPGIPMGDESVEILRTGPDIVLFKPEGSGDWTGYNEHFTVFENPSGSRLPAVWAQSSCEGRGDNRLVIAHSPGGSAWSSPEYIAGAKPGKSDKQASWGSPVQGRLGFQHVQLFSDSDIYLPGDI